MAARTARPCCTKRMCDHGQFANGVAALIVTEDIVRATWSPECQAIRTHHADRVAGGSGVALLQRIDEELIILSELDATEAAMRAFSLHPLFQPRVVLPTAS
ncbi:hypothetical protein [Variovorax rhizosphaerae]|uniref:Uncharacterized protein n=1 Tax=Variovorax rhizosphaerae TaxID=1836200 RepID=A0ABU8WYG5_9BURK